MECVGVGNAVLLEDAPDGTGWVLLKTDQIERDGVLLKTDMMDGGGVLLKTDMMVGTGCY